MALIDLHLHSIFSDDGQYLPSELVDQCIKQGVKYAAIADHNSVRGVNEAIRATHWKDIEIIPAIELDGMFNALNLHILGYGIDTAAPFFETNEMAIMKQEQQASKTRMEKIRNLGINFDDAVIEELQKNSVVTGEMIAEAAILHDVEQQNPLLQAYYPGGERSDNPFVNFYWDFCHQGKPGYVEIRYVSLQEAIRMICEAGGIPILAHPGMQVNEDAGLLEAIVAAGVEGLEVFSSYHSPEQTQFYLDFARAHGLLFTAGSDYHGKIKPSIQIGSSPCDGLEEEIIQTIKQAIMKRWQSVFRSDQPKQRPLQF